MKATGNYEQVKNVDPLVVLNEHTRHHIEEWVARFPPDRKRSALIQALFAAQEQNHGFLTDELITAVAKYIELPTELVAELDAFAEARGQTFRAVVIDACRRHLRYPPPADPAPFPDVPVSVLSPRTRKKGGAK